jgi:hypothetical protein
LKEEKLEQLRKIFEEEIRSTILTASQFPYVDMGVFSEKTKELIKNKANQLVYEVKIRINNK